MSTRAIGASTSATVPTKNAVTMGVAHLVDRAPLAKTATIPGPAWVAKANLADRLHG